MVFLNYADLRARGIRYSRVHLARLVKAGKFPAPVKFTPGGRNSWVEHEVNAAQERLLAERSTKTA
jgi:predicted DNA-binding transcriptional regulator AlpA